MKKVALIAGAVVIGLATYFMSAQSAEAECTGARCPPKKCSFDISCGIGCFCYKGQYELYGVCVSE